MSVDKMRVTVLTVCAGLGAFESRTKQLEGILPNAESVHALFYHGWQDDVWKFSLVSTCRNFCWTPFLS